MPSSKTEIKKNGRIEIVAVFLDNACIPPHKKGIAKSGAFILKRRFNEKKLATKQNDYRVNIPKQDKWCECAHERKLLFYRCFKYTVYTLHNCFILFKFMQLYSISYKHIPCIPIPYPL